MWVKTAGTILRNRIAFIIGVLILTIFMGYQATKVEMSYEYSALLPASDTASKEAAEFKGIFGQESNIIILAVQDPDFYQLDKINDWIGLGDSLLHIDGIDARVSIAHTFNMTKNSKEKRFQVNSIFPKKVKSKKELDSLAAIAESLPVYQGTLINKETDTYTMFVTVNSSIMHSPARVPLVKNVKSICDEFGKKYNLELKYSGLPYIRVVNAEMIKKEMNMFLILSLLITTIILYLFFRSFKIVGFCMLIIGVSVVWAVGFMGLFGYKITLLTAMLPPLLVVIGIPNSVFMVNKFHGEFVIHGNKIKALQRMIRKIGNATFLTNLTTASGFATFTVTSSQILKEFGIITSLNIMMVFIICLILIPCIFSFLAPPDTKQTRHLENKFVNKLVEKMINVVLGHRTKVYIITIVAVVIGGFGMSKMISTGFMLDDLPEDNRLVKDLRFFEDNFKGIMPLEIMVDTKKKKGALSLSTLRRIEKLSDSLQSSPYISPSLSIATATKFANQAFYNGKEKYFKLPNNQTKNFLLSYLSKSQISGNGPDFYGAFIDSTQQYARMSLRIKDIGTKKMEETEKFVKDKVKEIFPEKKYRVLTTGSSVLFFKGTQYLVKNLAVSLLLAILLIAGFMAWMFSSKRMVLVALIPNLVPLIMTAALMGYFGIPIKASTILIFSIAFGISVDDTIHYLAKYRQELQATDWSIRSSVVLALRETGQSMMYTSIILFCGFAIFGLSGFGGTASLGILVSITLLAAMISNLILLPSLLLTLEKLITNKSFKEPLLQIYDEEEDIELDFLKIEEKDQIKEPETI
jgi:predicted RND superfamily exporter protein